MGDDKPALRGRRRRVPADDIYDLFAGDKTAYAALPLIFCRLVKLIHVRLL